MPERLTTISGISSMRSKVVYRWPHPEHSRRRRMAAPSSATLESTTRSSSARHQGQRTDTRLVPIGCALRWRRPRIAAAGTVDRVREW